MRRIKRPKPDGTFSLYKGDLKNMAENKGNKIGFINDRNYYSEYAQLLKRREDEKNEEHVE